MATRNVDVYADELERGGHFDATPESPDGNCQMVIGLVGEEWGGILSTAMHEAIELAAVDTSTRWEPTVNYSLASDAYLFIMTHPQFGEVICRAGWLLSKFLNKLHAAHKKFHANKKKKPKPKKKPKKKAATARRAK